MKKWSTWILTALSGVVVLAVAAMALRQSKSSAAEFFAIVESRIAEGRYDPEQTLLNLDHALTRARDAGDGALVARVQLARGRMLRDVGAFDRAREDLEAVAIARPDDRDVEQALVDLDVRTGDFRRGIQRVEALLAREPEDASAHALLGRLHHLAGSRSIDSAHAVLDRLLPTEESQSARALLEQAAALDPSDPRRVSLGHRLRRMIDPADEPKLEGVLDSVERASEDFAAARTRFEHALQRRFQSEALAGLLELYERAGRTPLAVDLAASAMHFEGARADLDLARAHIEALVSLGRVELASEIAFHWVTKQTALPIDFLMRASEIFRRAGRADGMGRAASLVAGIGNQAQFDAAAVYLGLSDVRHKNWNVARLRLERFAKSDLPEPFPGARAEAWRQLAVTARALEQPERERESLRAALDLEPDSSGEAWIRLAELQLESPRGGYRGPDEHYVRGMSLLPKRTAQLLPRWEEIGRKELASVGFDPEAARQDLVTRGAVKPPSDASPYVLYRMTKLHIENQDLLRASAFAKELNSDFPAFVPGIDLALEIALAQDRPADIIAALVARLGAAGRDARCDEALRNIAVDDLSPTERLALMRADPTVTGRVAIASWLAQHGDAEQALRSLEAVGIEALAEPGRLLAAQLHLQRDDPVRALEYARTLGAVLTSMPRALETFADAAIGTRSFDELAQACARVAATANTVRQRERWIALCDRLMPRGGARAALALLQKLDAGRTTRGGDVVVRLAAAHAALGDDAAAEAAFLRAEAFDTRSEGELLRLLVELRAGRTDGIDGLARTLIATSSMWSQASPARRAALYVLAGRDEDARKLVTSLPGHEPLDELARAIVSARDGIPWSPPEEFGAAAGADTQVFVRGPDGRRDPREAAALLFGSGSPVAAAVVRSWLLATSPETHGVVWTSWLAMTIARNAGAPPTAVRRTLDPILAMRSDFAPVWDVAEGYDTGPRATLSQIAGIRTARARVLGEDYAPPVERELDRAREHELAGDLEAARGAARRACEIDPSFARAHEARADLELRLGDPLAAVAAYREAARTSKAPGPRAELVGKFLDALQRARLGESPLVTAEHAQKALDAMARSAPDDPRVVLELARLDLGIDVRNPSLGVSRALTRLEGFRARHKGQALENLARGALASWAEFRRALDPDEALRFVESEMALEPAASDVWTELARCHEARGDDAATVAAARLAADLVPGGDSLRELFRLRTRRSTRIDDIDRALAEIRAVEGSSGSGAELGLLQARAYLNAAASYVDLVITVLEGLEPWLDLSPSFRLRHGMLNVTARLQRSTPEDLEKARAVLASIEPLASDPYQRSFISAMRGLARANESAEPVAH